MKLVKLDNLIFLGSFNPQLYEIVMFFFAPSSSRASKPWVSLPPLHLVRSLVAASLANTIPNPTTAFFQSRVRSKALKALRKILASLELVAF